MKNITIVIALCVVVLSACKKEKNSGLYMSANIAGASFYADSSDSNSCNSLSCTKIQGYSALIAIDVSKCDGSRFNIEVQSGYTGKGNYVLTAANSFAYYYGSDGSEWKVSDENTGSSGTLTITSDVNNVIEGTFSLDALCAIGCDSGTVKHITKGKFSLPIIYQ